MVSVGKPLCTDCGKNPALGKNNVGDDPTLCEPCNIKAQLEGRFGIEDDETLCVRCWENPRLQQTTAGGANSTLCAKCREEVRAVGSKTLRVDDPWCVRCHQRPRKNPGKASSSTLCTVCIEETVKLKEQLKRQKGLFPYIDRHFLHWSACEQPPGQTKLFIPVTE